MLLLLPGERALAFLGALAVLSSAAPPSTSDETEAPSRKGLRVFVSKKGAKIRLLRELPSPPGTSPAPTGSTGNAASNPNPRITGMITIIFDGVKEVDGNGTQVSGGQGGQNSKHSIDSLSNLDFTVSPVADTQLPNSNAIPADCITLDATSTTPAGHFKAVICITKGNGTVTLGDEQTEVKEGQLKFTFMVDQWQWCDSTCASGKVGKYLDVDINVKIPPGRAMGSGSNAPGDGKRPKRFGLGADAMADFSKKVYVDGAWMDMSAGYPLMEQRGANHFITLRLPRFTGYVTYDPTVDAGYSAESKGSFTLQSLSLGIITSFMTLLVSGSSSLFGFS